MNRSLWNKVIKTCQKHDAGEPDSVCDNKDKERGKKEENVLRLTDGLLICKTFLHSRFFLANLPVGASGS